jgi:hypothetical protein
VQTVPGGGEVSKDEASRADHYAYNFQPPHENDSGVHFADTLAGCLSYWIRAKPVRTVERHRAHLCLVATA